MKPDLSGDEKFEIDFLNRQKWKAEHDFYNSLEW